MNKTRSYKIADTLITLDWSRSRMPPLPGKNRITDKFILKTNKDDPDIAIQIEYGRLPDIKTTSVFKTSAYWKLSRIETGYVYETLDRAYRSGVSMAAVFDKDFKNGTIFFEANKKNGWRFEDIMSDFMQVLLLNFLSHNKLGVLAHSSMLRYKDVSLAFFGKSTSGKSTMVELWSKNAPKVNVFNDDRCVIRQGEGGLKIYSTPWPGTFTDYGISHKAADVDNAYFIYHSRENKAERLSRAAAFASIMQNIFLPFWSRDGMDFIVYFCHKFVRDVDCYKLGFINDASVIGFLKKRFKIS